MVSSVQVAVETGKPEVSASLAQALFPSGETAMPPEFRTLSSPSPPEPTVAPVLVLVLVAKSVEVASGRVQVTTWWQVRSGAGV